MNYPKPKNITDINSGTIAPKYIAVPQYGGQKIQRPVTEFDMAGADLPESYWGQLGGEPTGSGTYNTIPKAVKMAITIGVIAVAGYAVYKMMKKMKK